MNEKKISHHKQMQSHAKKHMLNKQKQEELIQTPQQTLQ